MISMYSISPPGTMLYAKSLLMILMYSISPLGTMLSAQFVCKKSPDDINVFYLSSRHNVVCKKSPDDINVFYLSFRHNVVCKKSPDDIIVFYLSSRHNVVCKKSPDDINAQFVCKKSPDDINVFYLSSRHNVVCKKSPDDINATYDENKEIKFSKKLPNNRLCKVLQDYFEQWLRLMLRWDPKARGGGIINIKGIERPKCFCLLEIFTELKLIRILYVEMNTVLSFPINETHTIQEVQKAISVELNIPPEQQLILLANGTKLEPNNFALDGWNDHASEDIIVFLFRLAPLQLPPKHGKKLPPQVQAIAKEPMTLLPTKDHRKAWAQAVYWCTDVNQDYKRLVVGHRAALLNLMKNMSSLNKLKFQLSSEIGKLMSCTDLFKASLEFDLLKYQETFKGKPFTQDIYHNWSIMADTINNYIHLRKRVEDLEENVQRFVSEFNEIQKKPTTGTELEEYEMKSKGLYGKLLQITPGNGSYEMMSHQSMVDLVGRCFMKRDELTKVLYKHLSTILELLERLEPLYPEMETASKEIQAASEQLKSMQCRRQGDLWTLLACQSYPTNGESTLVPSGMTHTNTSMHICQSFESLQLMDDSKNYTQRLQELLETVVKEQDESLKYLSSLNSNS
ncbi:inhibitor of nuclear factor kappa-B kinase subunit alpha [Biomphalaria pfeifferi]|uniref:Inhibitor of nuclear factor kappa-B kinase subunit alpha n=1 Tax=Biomphalaria pfeifferi TaxID=112525 RepID=A0AAD8B829_BIOPF|nr:inhibitor of nuclear factor kappa-B kinase subunit alpha [Biomphalaria pfeifferi]